MENPTYTICVFQELIKSFPYLVVSSFPLLTLQFLSVVMTKYHSVSSFAGVNGGGEKGSCSLANYVLSTSTDRPFNGANKIWPK